MERVIALSIVLTVSVVPDTPDRMPEHGKENTRLTPIHYVIPGTSSGTTTSEIKAHDTKVALILCAWVRNTTICANVRKRTLDDRKRLDIPTAHAEQVLEPEYVGRYLGRDMVAVQRPSSSGVALRRRPGGRRIS